MKAVLEDPLVESGIIEKNFVNSVALNFTMMGQKVLPNTLMTQQDLSSQSIP